MVNCNVLNIHVLKEPLFEHKDKLIKAHIGIYIKGQLCEAIILEVNWISLELRVLRICWVTPPWHVISYLILNGFSRHDVHLSHEFTFFMRANIVCISYYLISLKLLLIKKLV